MLLEIVCQNCYCCKLFIGAFVVGMEKLLLKLLLLELMLMLLLLQLLLLMLLLLQLLLLMLLLLQLLLLWFLKLLLQSDVGIRAIVVVIAVSPLQIKKK
jgi:hypothetical protein